MERNSRPEKKHTVSVIRSSKLFWSCLFAVVRNCFYLAEGKKTQTQRKGAARERAEITNSTRPLGNYTLKAWAGGGGLLSEERNIYRKVNGWGRWRGGSDKNRHPAQNQHVGTIVDSTWRLCRRFILKGHQQLCVQFKWVTSRVHFPPYPTLEMYQTN